jgi:hypothetical protein
MKRIVWIVSAVVVVAWTLGALLTAELVEWAAGALSAGGAADIGRAVLGWPVPAWLSAWADPAWIEAGRDGMARLLQSMSDALPFVGSALGWMTPVVWTIWALGTVLVLAIAGVCHMLAGRRRRGPGPLRTV